MGVVFFFFGQSYGKLALDKDLLERVRGIYCSFF